MTNADLFATLRPRLRIVRGSNHKGEFTGWCPFHPDGHGKAPHSPSFCISERGWYCHACGRGGSLLSLAKEIGVEVSGMNYDSPGSGIVARYPYEDEAGTLLFEKVRLEPKRFYQRRPDGNGGWINDLIGVRLVLYRLRELLTNPDATVFIVEGEKDVDRLRSMGFVATTNPGGAGKWRSEFTEFLRGRHVVILPDNDRAGNGHAGKVATSLAEIAATIKILPLPGLREKEDVSDWMNAGHTADELRALAAATPVFGSAEVGADSPDLEAIVVNLGDVEPEQVEWLWPRFIPIGKLTILEGDPGVGKTSVALAIASIVTRGYPFPDIGGGSLSSTELAGVIYMSAEDGLADTLRPRLDAYGGDASRVNVITGIRARNESGKALPRDITLQDVEILDAVLAKLRPRLVVVDPLQAYLGPKVDMHRANETRPILSALARLAERHRCAVLCIRHLGKSPQERAVYRGLGSVDFAAAARSILLVAPSPVTPQVLILVQVKCSLALRGSSIEFQLLDKGLYWGGSSDLTADDLLGSPPSRDELSAIEEAVQFLENLLQYGALPSKQVKSHARKERISEASLRRAKKQLGVTSYCSPAVDSGGRQEWMWRLPERSSSTFPNCPVEQLAHSVQQQNRQGLGLLNQPAHLSNMKEDCEPGCSREQLPEQA